jgi:molybdopterin/thiamine biosynthesis adenylyltransferase
MSSLTPEARRRYARHVLLPELGEEGQMRVMGAHVLMVGAGGLGASALSYLAAMGVGTISIVDADTVELSNLNRQILFEVGDIGRMKVASAADRIGELNPDVHIIAHPIRFTEQNAEALLEGVDLLLDGSDNFETRYAINRACLNRAIPWVYSAVRGFEAQLSCFDVQGAATPCYQCLVPESPPERQDCAERGVLGALVGVMGSIMAVEAVKLLTGIGSPYHHRLLRYHALTGAWKESALLRDPSCPACSAIASKKTG